MRAGKGASGLYRMVLRKVMDGTEGVLLQHHQFMEQDCDFTVSCCTTSPSARATFIVYPNNFSHTINVILNVLSWFLQLHRLINVWGSTGGRRAHIAGNLRILTTSPSFVPVQ